MTTSPNEQKNRQVEGKRAFTPARVVALVLIGLLVLGLGYIRLNSGDSSLSVPSGAKAGGHTPGSVDPLASWPAIAGAGQFHTPYVL